MSTFPALEARTPSDLTLQGLYERHAERIFGYCRRRLRSHEEAEDAVQETFLSAMRALQRGCVPVCETAWLFKIAEHTCCSVYRSRARRDACGLAGMERVERPPSRTEDDDSLIASVETLIYRARRSLAQALESGAGRLTASLNLGSLVAAAKSLFTGATALKVASTTAVVAVAAVTTGDTAQQRREPPPASSPTPTKVMSVRNSAVWGAPRNGEPTAVPPLPQLPQLNGGVPDPGGLLPGLPQHP